MDLWAIGSSGDLGARVCRLSAEARAAIEGTVGHYADAGFEPPWVGYLAVVDGEAVGTCAFKAAPADGRVEIAYYTFPAHENRGYATAMAKRLVEIAAEADPGVVVAAQTLPGESPSTSVLRRLGFGLVGPVDHPVDGRVWEWRMRTAEAPARDRDDAFVSD